MVDVDEKWFYTMALRLLLKIPPGSRYRGFIRHKSHVPKTMFLAALGRRVLTLMARWASGG